jgi:hypothetical protein
MGCKLHLLIGSLFSVKRAGNILISYNNDSARRAIPLVEQLSAVTEVEFTPTPEQTHELIAANYNVRRNLLIRFKNDEIDRTEILQALLKARFADFVSLKILNGTHTTPIAQEMAWQAGNAFSPLDALGQWFKQEFYRDLNVLTRELSHWLDPGLSPSRR